jgi:hypothetical protein
MPYFLFFMAGLALGLSRSAGGSRLLTYIVYAVALALAVLAAAYSPGVIQAIESAAA